MYIGKWNVVNIILEVAKPTFKCHPRPHEAQADKMMTRKVKRYLTNFGHCLNVIQWSLENSIHMLQLNIYVYRTPDNAYDIPFKCLTCVHIFKKRCAWVHIHVEHEKKVSTCNCRTHTDSDATSSLAVFCPITSLAFSFFNIATCVNTIFKLLLYVQILDISSLISFFTIALFMRTYPRKSHNALIVAWEEERLYYNFLPEAKLFRGL